MDEQDDQGYLASSSSNADSSLKDGNSRRPSALSFQLPNIPPRASVASTRHTASFASVFSNASLAPPVLTINAPFPTASSRSARNNRPFGPPLAWGVSPRAASSGTFLVPPVSPMRQSQVGFSDDRRPSLPISIPASSVSGFSRRGSGFDPTIDLSKSEPGPSRLDEPWNLSVDDIFGAGGFMLGGYSAPPGITALGPYRSTQQPGSSEERDPFLSMVEADDPDYAASKVAWSIRLKTAVDMDPSFGRTAAIWTCPLFGSFRVSQTQRTPAATSYIYVTSLEIPHIGLHSVQSDITVRVTLKCTRETYFYLQHASSEQGEDGGSSDPATRILLASRVLHVEEDARQSELVAHRAATATGDTAASRTGNESQTSPPRLTKRSTSISRLAHTLSGHHFRHARPQQPTFMDFVKRAFGFKRPLRQEPRTSPTSLSPVLSRPSTSTITDSNEAELGKLTLLIDVGPEDMCMVVPVSDPLGTDDPATSITRDQMFESPRSDTVPPSLHHLLICYVPWTIASAVPRTPAQEWGNQVSHEELLALYAKFRSYRILARPISKSEVVEGHQSPRSRADGLSSPLQLIGFCESPLQGVEFVPETLRAVGLCEEKATPDVWFSESEEWRNMAVTPGGREALHMIWAGCVALSGLGRI